MIARTKSMQNYSDTLKEKANEDAFESFKTVSQYDGYVLIS